MSGHTKGPWTPHDMHVRYEGPSVCIMAENRRHYIAAFPWVVPVNEARKAEWDANIRLIAAAPDLYEALKSLTEACEGDFFGSETNDCADDEAVGGGTDGDMCLTFGAIRRARAALAKAEGRV